MAIGGVPVSAEWSESGTGQADYQITAVYSDAETEPYLKKHVYLFGFQQNQPKVLVTQQNQGNPDNYLYFNETANNELKMALIKSFMDKQINEINKGCDMSFITTPCSVYLLVFYFCVAHVALYWLPATRSYCIRR